MPVPLGDTGNLIVAIPPQLPPINVEITPQILEPLVGGQNPDFTADAIFCNNLTVKNAIIQGGGGSLGPIIVGSTSVASYIQFYGPDVGNGYTQSMQIQLKYDPVYLQTALWITNNESFQPCLVYMFPSDTSNACLLIAMFSNSGMQAGGGNSSFISFGTSGVTAGKTGTAGQPALRLWTGATSTQGGGFYGWQIDPLGHWQARNDGTQDMGQSGSAARNVFASGAVKTGGKAGVAIDADVNTPTDGMLRFDSTNNRLYVRIGGTWRYAALT